MITPFDLNLRHLRALSAIERHGSMSRAAEAVSLSQPALTQGLSKLERQLDATLFDRRFDGMSATAEGRAATLRVDAALAHLAHAARSVSRRDRRGFAQPEFMMTSAQARAFLAVADAGSFVGAAQATGLSEPAVHRAVRDVELLFAAPLIERRGRGVVVSPAGLRLARGVRLAGRELAAMLAELAAEPPGAGRLTIGAMPLCRALILPATIARFTHERPDITIDIVEGSWRELVDPLRDGVLDLMIGALRDTPPPECVQAPLSRDRLAIIGRAGHPLAAVAHPTPAQLASHSWIVGQSGTPLRQQWETLFTGEARPRAPIECGSVMVIRGILAGGDFLALLSPDQVALEISSGVLARIGPELENSERTIGVTTRESWRPTTSQSRFLELLEEVAAEARGQTGIQEFR